MQPICEIMVTLDFIFRLMLYSHEDVSFNINYLNVFEGIIQFHLSMWFKQNRLETPFKGDNVKALIKTSNCEELGFLFLLDSLENCSICYAFFGFSDQTIA